MDFRTQGRTVHRIRSAAPDPATASAPRGAAQREPGPIRFGAFVAIPKMISRWAGVWSRILSALPDSTLLFKTAGTQDRFAKPLQAEDE